MIPTERLDMRML